VTDTVVSSATREVVIGFDRPFVIIGERINPTGRKILAAEMAAATNREGSIGKSPESWLQERRTNYRTE
jgi:cobalamin-dependent methionine synthase I